MSDKIKVSICCLVFNHEKYLRKCLDGFVMQKTDFEYEVLIHDDASSDGSPDIIREYENQYPNIFKPIYQQENKFSKGVDISWEYQYPRAKGKYIALCEGDDFWTDTNKLQQQFDLMEKDESITMCTHTVNYVNESGKPTGRVKPNPMGKDKYMLSQDFVRSMMQGDFYPFQTSSYFLRADVFKKLHYKIPPFIRECKVGDVTLMMLFGYYGNIAYIAKEMSCYRVMAENSWSRRVLLDNEKLAEHKANLVNILLKYDEFSGYVFHDEISERINEFRFDVYYFKCQYTEMKKEPYKKYYNKLSRKRKIYVFAHAKVPFALKIYQRIKGNKDLDDNVIGDR